jgi:hypothetical protein
VTGVSGPEVPSTGGDQVERSCDCPTSCAVLLASRDGRHTGSSTFRERRPDLSPDRFHGGIEAACAPSASADGDLHEHDHGPFEHPDRRVCDRGDCRSSIELPRSRAITGGARGQGQRNTVPRRSPSRLLATETSPRPRTRPDASCRGHLFLALSGVTWGERGTAVVRRACMARRREGRATTSFREETRRSPARGTFHHEIVRERTKAFSGGSKLP